jgi:autotransporter-associated beta strand protein
VINIDPFTIGSNLTGTGGFAKGGVGALTLTGTYGVTGNLTVNAGTLTLPAGAGASATSVYSGAILNTVGDYSAGASIGLYNGAQGGGAANIGGNLNVGQISTDGGTTLSSTGNISATTNIFLNGGTLQTSGGSITNAGTLFLSGVGNVIRTNGGNLTTGDITASNALINLGAAGALTVNQTLTDGVIRGFSGAITGGSTFTKNGAGSLTLNLTTPMTYTGATSLNGGSLIWGANNVLPSSTVLNISGSAFFNLNGYDQTVAGINFIGGGTASSSNILSTGTLTLAGDLTVGPAGSGGGGFSISGTGVVDLGGAIRNFNIAGNGGSTQSARIRGSIRNGGINYTGTPGTGAGSPPAVLALSGQNTYTGGTFINQGTLRAELAGALPSGGIVTFGTPNSAIGGTLDLWDGTENQSGGAVHTVAGITTAAGNTAGSNNRIINSRRPAVLQVNNTEDFVFSGAIAPATTSFLGLIKSGPGRLTLSGTGNTYTGATTVNGGNLNITGSIAAGSLVTVNSGGILSGSGSVGAITLNPGGILAPSDLGGIALIGDGLSATSLLFNPGGQINFRLGATSSVSDRLVLSSALLKGTGGAETYFIGFSSAGLQLSQGPQIYDLITYNDIRFASDFTATDFTAKGVDNLTGIDGTFQIANAGTDAAILQFLFRGATAAEVPEPGTLVLFVLGMGGAVAVSSCRRRQP